MVRDMAEHDCLFGDNEEQNFRNRERVEYIAEMWGTPFYLFKERKAKENIRALRSCLKNHAKIAYAMKANPWIAGNVSDEADYIEVCSEGELDICIKGKIPEKKIVIDGVYKEKKFIQKAIEYGVERISIDSVCQMKVLTDILDVTKKVEVLLRVSSGNQFGMEEEEIDQCLKLADTSGNINVVGIQYYSGTQKNSREQVRKALEKLACWIHFFEDKVKFPLSVIEFGAGIGVPYFEKEEEGKYRKALEEVSAFIKELHLKYTVVYEAGRVIAASCGEYVTQIYARKVNGNKKILFCKGGTNHLQYYGGVLGVRTPKLELIARNLAGEKETYMVCGSLCSESDVLSRESEIDMAVDVGDYLVFQNAGAYSTEASYLFLCMEMPMVLVYNGSDEQFDHKLISCKNYFPTYDLFNDKV